MLLRRHCARTTRQARVPHERDEPGDVYDGSEKTEAYWDGLSGVIEDLAVQVEILQSAPWPIQVWDKGQSEEAFLVELDEQRRHATRRGAV